MLGQIQYQQRRLREQNTTLQELNHSLLEMKRKLITQEQHNDKLKYRYVKDKFGMSDSVIQNMSHISLSGGFETPVQFGNEDGQTTLQVTSTIASHSTNASQPLRSIMIQRERSDMTFEKGPRKPIAGGDRRLSLRPSPFRHGKQLTRHGGPIKYADSNTSASSTSDHIKYINSRSSIYGYQNVTKSQTTHLQSWRDMQLAHNQNKNC
ncbi:hypothetical protein K450DRAFT_226975 [Umbelopsis ramanniana AG]|uniref:Uncharacterized protein n=1 Tax=Umbelopsis ramanniana AG TaxID=1314678 RepID=A0AAD5HHN3_UMBRA|nr:uncharacterized protein K450DRAFT_226975 [Umbelopsis ramanniana AG]KAI8582393.1 hypothetical protein K450DRAFT_226975 [Umbelopsis ramanniana AG]